MLNVVIHNLHRGEDDRTLWRRLPCTCTKLNPLLYLEKIKNSLLQGKKLIIIDF